jgi:hypothetical protein
MRMPQAGDALISENDRSFKQALYQVKYAGQIVGATPV